MDHGSMGGMDHGSGSSSSMGDMGSMGHDMGMGKCKISMLFNVNTIGSCFFTENWYIETAGQFAGACIVTILLVVSLEMLRRSAREYDRFLVRQHVERFETASRADSISKGAGSDSEVAVACKPRMPALRPSVVQQGIRAFLHMLQFGLAYIIMLLAMYYNGYIFLCIIIGAFIGFFAFNWEPLVADEESSSDSGVKEATVCCG